MQLQIAKWGNSLAMRLPADLVRRFGLRDGDSIDAQLTADGSLTIRPAGWSRRALLPNWPKPAMPFRWADR